ncbi:hypothetical protein BU26DRAFT_507437 [Trematosphaeria pertusa]|uniref:Uncharacterized protein n=1 Tax=Trematosphaeria pertusa TaxID=390896 RepID=A0A6A6IBP0_9PLEO|nr:uncharacterized protein BU26DRAFT_507437 [Trematosphaeria pertusa]KAF2246913.1 hypothetical protein BU26DRAFT_507437 [Trematosphaeria pertusa]
MPPKCSHTIPAFLQSKLPNPNLCPPCLINRHIKEIRDTQQGIETRGGILASKKKAIDEKEASGKKDVQAKRHRAWMRKWRSVKIQAWEDVEMLEGLLKEEQVIEEEGEELDWRNMVQEALDLWEGAREDMTVVPGVPGVLPTEDEQDNRSDADDDDGNDAEARQDVGYSDQEKEPQDIPLPATSDDDLAEPEERTPSRRTHRPLKPVRFHDVATVHDSTSPIHTEQPHSPHTFADSPLHRSRDNFYRPSRKYKPHIWSSPKGHEKVQTSWFFQSWEAVERAGQGFEEEEEEEDEDEEESGGIEIEDGEVPR